VPHLSCFDECLYRYKNQYSYKDQYSYRGYLILILSTNSNLLNPGVRRENKKTSITWCCTP
jgi:hypothetical protein